MGKAISLATLPGREGQDGRWSREHLDEHSEAVVHHFGSSPGLWCHRRRLGTVSAASLQELLDRLPAGEPERKTGLPFQLAVVENRRMAEVIDLRPVDLREPLDPEEPEQVRIDF